LNERRVENLTRFVQRGGYLTLRTGMKDEFNALLLACQPGPLAALSGVEVEDYYALVEPALVQGKLLEGVSNIWAERLKILDTNLYRSRSPNCWRPFPEISHRGGDPSTPEPGRRRKLLCDQSHIIGTNDQSTLVSMGSSHQTARSRIYQT
jgi:hypothetical protein